MTGEAYCGKEEHAHAPETCYERVLACGYREGGGAAEGASAGGETGAGATAEATAGATEGATEGATDGAAVEAQAAHQHGEGCYETRSVLVCGREEDAGHAHAQDCYERREACGQGEREAHTHSQDCYDEEDALVCGLDEDAGHAHSESCYEEVLVCVLEEREGHAHVESCFQDESVLVCQEPAGEAVADPSGGTAEEGAAAAEPAGAFEGASEGVSEDASEEAPAERHVHTDACYEERPTCGQEEHAHSLACYANPEADLEDASVWESTLPQDLGDDWARNVAAVATSQLGYEESTANYVVPDDGTAAKGYTRYGAWYGDPYGDWCAMFASFCLYYAGVPESAVPYDSGCARWVERLQGAGLYENAADCPPEPGSLVFFDLDGDALADHVGVVTEVAPEGEGLSVATVEGNVGGAVASRGYSDTDGSILGYCALPKNPGAQADEDAAGAAATDLTAEAAAAAAAVDADGSVSDTAELGPYLTDAKIVVDGAEYVEGTTLPAAKEFGVRLGFSNVNSQAGTTFTYTLPSQIRLPQDITDGVLTDATGTKQGVYTVTKDEATGAYILAVTPDADYAAAHDYLDIGVEMFARWNVDGSGEYEVDFGGGHVKKVKIDADTKMVLDKTHTATGKRDADYSIVVTAVTGQTGVRLTDAVVQGGVSYADDGGEAVAAEIGATLKVGGTIRAVLTDAAGNATVLDEVAIADQDSLAGYLSSRTFDMGAGDTLTVSYPMEFAEGVAYTADANDLTLKTTNVATASSNEVPEALSATESWSYVGQKGNIIQKSGEVEDDSVRWELTLNAGGNYPMAGTAVHDRLMSSSLGYDTGKPFVVEVYQGASLVHTISIGDWADNADGLALSPSGDGWEYVIPTIADASEQYTYRITYYTEVRSYDGSALNNAAGARFSQYPEVGVVGTAGRIDIGVAKLGALDDMGDAVAAWTVQYTVHAGSGIIQGFRIVDYLPSYTNAEGETVYSKLIDRDGNTPAVPADITAFCVDGGVFDITVADYASGADYTNDDAFLFLQSYQAWAEEGDFALIGADGSYFTLPAALGAYANGYTVTVRYRTQSPGIADGAELNNRAEGWFADLDGVDRAVSANARVSFDYGDLEDSVTLDKTGAYDADAGSVHYTVKVDTGNVGFRGASSVTIVDAYDSRLSFEGGSYGLQLSLDGAAMPLAVELRETSGANVRTEKVENPDGTTTWKTVFPTSLLYAEGHGTTLVPVEVHTTVDPDRHTFTVFLPYLYRYGETADDLRPVTYQLDYDMTPAGEARVYEAVANVVEATGDNGVRYGRAETTLSFGQNVTTKTLTDAERHEHSASECYSYDLGSQTMVLTCPLTADEPNGVLFKVRVDFGADELEDLTQLTVDDFMDINSLPPDLSKLQLRFVGKIPSGDSAALSFGDVCELAGVAGASYTAGLTETGLSVKVSLGVTVEQLCEAFYNSEAASGLAGGPVDLREWKLELSYPAKVRGNMGETVTVFNMASLRGVANSDSEVSYDKVVQGSGGGVEGKSYTLNLEKIDATVGNAGVGNAGAGNVGTTYLPGATFALCDEDGTVLATGTTGDDGKVAFGKQGAAGAGYCELRPYTAYYVTETVAPDGYVRNTSKFWFYFKAPDGTPEQESFTEEQKAALEALGCVPIVMDGSAFVTNSQSGSFKIKKVDGKTLETLTGAVFTLYGDEGCQTAVDTSSTAGDGVYLLDGLAPDTTYYFRETTAPAGYVLDETVHSVTVSWDGSVTVDGSELTPDGGTLAYVCRNSKAGYVLPQTGGTGALPFTLGGALLLTGGLLLGGASREGRAGRLDG